MAEHTKYEVIQTLGNIEIRAYPALLIARVEGYGDEGFSSLFRYITGKNRQKAKVAMTTPVVAERIAMTTPVLADTDSLAFILPQKYHRETAPEPTDDRIKIIDQPARKVAVFRFRGGWSKKTFDEYADKLLQTLKKLGMKTVGNIFSMRYNSPFMPWFLRRNEVAIEVA